MLCLRREYTGYNETAMKGIQMNKPSISTFKNMIQRRASLSLSIITQKISVIDASSLMHRIHRPNHAFCDSKVTTLLTVTEEAMETLKEDSTASLTFTIDGEMYEFTKIQY